MSFANKLLFCVCVSKILVNIDGMMLRNTLLIFPINIYKSFNLLLK